MQHFTVITGRPSNPRSIAVRRTATVLAFARASAFTKLRGLAAPRNEGDIAYVLASALLRRRLGRCLGTAILGAVGLRRQNDELAVAREGL
jgi:hypothetical protein